MELLPVVVEHAEEEVVNTINRRACAAAGTCGGRSGGRVDMQRTDILFSGMGNNGERLLCDVSGGTATCTSYAGQAAGTAGHVIRVIEGKKKDKYCVKCSRVGAAFMPFVFETHGRVSEVAISFMKTLVTRAAASSHIPYSMLLSYWMKRLSTTIQAGNADYLLSASRRIAAHAQRSLARVISGAEDMALLERVH